MNYLLKSKPKNENRKKVIWVFVLYFSISLFGFLFGNIWRGALWGISRPIWTVGNLISSPFGSLQNYFKFKNTLVENNLALSDKVTALNIKELDYDILQKENQSLKDELGRKTNSQRVLGAILSKPPRSPYDELVIDAGYSDGIMVGNKVFVSENIVIGTVISVTSHTSLVNLFSTGNQKLDAVLSRTGGSYTLKGSGGQNFQLEVPKDADIVWGDTFVYPGISEVVVASVYYIDTNSQSSFKTVYLRIPTNVFSAKYVFIEKTL